MIEQQDLYVNTGEFEKVCPFPIGYIYLSTSSTSPATIYGGTWTALTDSKFLRPSGSWNSTGGSTKISINQMPSHTHTADMCWIENTGNQTITRGKFVYRDSGRTTAQPTWDTSSVGGGCRLLATLPHLLRLVQNSLIPASWMEVNANGN